MAISLTSALEISINSPLEVDLNEEFTVSINADSSETHDVKIFIHSSDDEKIEQNEYISEIYSDGWKNPYYYLKESFPEKKEYKIKATSSPAKEICARLRKTGTSSFSTQCQSIKVLKSETEEETEDAEEDNEEIKENASIGNIQDDLPQQQIAQPSQLSLNSEKLFLNSPSEEKAQKTFITKQEKTRLGIIYSFTAFTLVVIILLALKKL
nr:hypothetical protein [uncultured archaeon]